MRSPMARSSARAVRGASGMVTVSGMTIEEILEDYPDLERDDLLAALEFGAKTAGMRRVPLEAA